MDIGIRVRPFINESPAGDTGVSTTDEEPRPYVEQLF